MKYLKYSILVLGIFVWMVGLNSDLSSKISKTDSYRYGDLYRLSNLSEFKDPVKFCTAYTPPPKATTRRVHLYVIGDSFTEKLRMDKDDFNADVYTHLHWNEVLHFKPDTSEINILLVESVERHFREKFLTGPIQNVVPDSRTFVDNGHQPALMHTLDGAFNSKATEGRLDEFLFQNDFILSLKEWKANFNLNVFDRTNQEVTRINNGQDLVYYMDTDTDTAAFTSSFAEIENTEIDTLVTNLNETRILAEKMGFDKVILSIIPNKVSVLMPEYGHYNQLIDRIYQHRNLKLDFVDVYGDFKRLGTKSYLKGDSHWTCEGQYSWLNKINTKVNQLVSSPIL
jgi:hypothetical protein